MSGTGKSPPSTQAQDRPNTDSSQKGVCTDNIGISELKTNFFFTRESETFRGEGEIEKARHCCPASPLRINIKNFFFKETFCLNLKKIFLF